MRTEKDSLGKRNIPDEAYWGAQTSRAIENFPISGLKEHELFVDSYMYLKKAAAMANKDKLGKKKDAIVKACDEILDGKLRNEFPVDVFQMGAGTAFHMNVNEVIANRATELMGGKKGEYLVHPNDDVNFGQSTNDTFPTAIRLSALLVLRKYLHKPLEELEKTFLEKGKEFDHILKSARTHLQDAVPIRLGQEFKAYGLALKKCRMHLLENEKGLYEIGIGGTAAGTGLNTAKGYTEHVIKILKELTGLPLRKADDMREAMQSHRPVAELSSSLRNLSLEMNRICNDLRLMASGPTTGFAEIKLPPVAPGSSIMPGKVNPSMLEMMNQVCYSIMGLDHTVALCVQAGQLELNVMMPVITYKLNFMITIFGNAVKQLNEKCIKGIKADEEKCMHYAESTMGLGTALNPYIGYEKAAEVVKIATKEKKTVIEVIREKKILTEEEISKIMDAKRMTRPGVAGEK